MGVKTSETAREREREIINRISLTRPLTKTKTSYERDGNEKRLLTFINFINLTRMLVKPLNKKCKKYKMIT